MSKVVIASVYPLKLRQVREGCHVYELEAVPRNGEPSILEIEDTIIYEQRLFTLGGGYEAKTVLAKDRAVDIVQHLTTGERQMGADAHPGVWICETGKPEPEDVAEMRRRTAAYFQRWVVEIDGWSPERRAKKLPTLPIAKTALAYLGLERDWGMSDRPEENQRCPYCTKLAPPDAATCPSCHSVVNPKRYAALKAKEQEALKAAGVVEAQHAQPGRPQPVGAR